MTEEQRKQCEEIYKRYIGAVVVPNLSLSNLNNDKWVKITISLAKVFNKDIKEAEKILMIINSLVINPLLSYSKFWATADYFDNNKENNNNKNEENKNFNNENKINNVVENTAKEKIMTEEQRKQCEEIINSYEEKYNKDLEEALSNIRNIPEMPEMPESDIKTVKNYISALLFYYDKSDSKWNITSPLHLEPIPQDKAKAKFYELLAEPKNKTVENIIDLTVSLSEVLCDGITKEEAEKFLFNKKSTEIDGTLSYLNIFTGATEKFIKIMKSHEKGYLEYENYEEEINSIKNIGGAIANYFDNNKENKINNVVEDTAKEKIMSNNDDLILNLLILGKTGVGKSSLVNALVGKKIEETGVGKPKTGRGIFPHEEEIDGKKINIYDSWGLEVGKDEEWQKLIGDELKKRGVDKDIKDWFHSVTYCIQAGGDRIEDFDIKIIKQFMDEKYNVIVALTKPDQIGKAKREKFIIEIEKAIKIKIIIYRALIKANLIKEVKEEFIKEIEEKIREIEFDQNAVKDLMLNQIEESKIDKFIREIEKEIKEANKIHITVIPVAANPEQLDHMTEKPKPYGLPEYKAAILVSWRELFIDKIPRHIIEKLKKDIEEAKSNAPREGKDLEKLAKEIQEYFINVVNVKLQNNIKYNFEEYYKITSDILAASKNIDISNLNLRRNIDDTTYIFSAFDFNYDALETVVNIVAMVLFAPLTIISGLIDLISLIAFKINKSKKIDEFINEVSQKIIDKISEEEFESEIRKVIIDTLNEIDKKIIKLN